MIRKHFRVLIGVHYSLILYRCQYLIALTFLFFTFLNFRRLISRNMSVTPNKRLHEDGESGSGSGNHSHPSVLKYPHDDQGTYSGVGGKVISSARHDYHASYDMGQEGQLPKVAPRNESRDADRRSPLLPNMLFRVSTPSDSHSDHVGSESRMEFRDSKDSIKEIKVENRDMKLESRESQQTAKCD